MGTDNESNQSAAVSIMATKGHTGEYMFGSEAAVMTVVENLMIRLLTKRLILSGHMIKQEVLLLHQAVIR